ncbi:hypothetical protein SAMN02745172_02443 [Pseudoxanthobacter soli DSM 19599]|uniref:Uncharacterized protein n=1 Tax=Pseudoxanthobacter soli DSM 19599 TaxID=1123029 RepID=A0A1M7ZMB4_9HYPH|nr:hypothetical protein [Pseudoxanthobacter soli]SHO65796.1 hypothetical protein SAMN02745172_02443 [Pseudoxanthobacter soli DSM 19599]
MSIYLIEHTHGGQFVRPADLDRAVKAADGVLARLGINTPVEFAAAAAAFNAKIDEEPYDAALADAFEAAKQAADCALTDGWHDPSGAGLWLVPFSSSAE